MIAVMIQYERMMLITSYSPYLKSNIKYITIAKLINIIGANLFDGENAIKIGKIIAGKRRTLPLCLIHLSFIL